MMTSRKTMTMLKKIWIRRGRGKGQEEESYLETIVRDIMDKFSEDLSTYVVNPGSPDDVTQNDSIKKFIKLKVKDKVLESFECRQVWEDD